MKKSECLFLDILKASLSDETYALPADITHHELEDLLKLSDEHNVFLLVYHAIHESMDRTLRKIHQQKIVTAVYKQVTQILEGITILEGMQRQGIDFLLTKGLICRRLYPQPLLRPSVDEDLLIDPKDFQKCHDYLSSQNMMIDQSDVHWDACAEVSYHKYQSPVYFEIHASLFPEDFTDHGDLNSLFPDLDHHMMTVNLDGVWIKTLDPTYHFLYLILHAYKHFLHSGFGIRMVCDLVMHMRNYDKDINYQYCQKALHQVHASHFAASIVKIGVEHLGLEISPNETLTAWIKEAPDETLLLEDILASGLHGAVDENRVHSSNMTLDAASHGKRGRILHLKSSLFPSYRYMKDRYKMLRKVPFLLPGAYVYRIGHYLFRSRNSSLRASKSLKIGRQRIKLLAYYHIIE